MSQVPLALRLYRAVANLAWPLFAAHVARKLARAGVTPDRRAERSGVARLPRPQGPLIWAHGASVGEVLSLLPLIDALGRARPDWQFLITSGTATSAQAVAGRLPPRTRHQFAPLDAARPLVRFLDHWRPTGAIFVESELWPQTLALLDARHIPRVLVNARLSRGSARNWGRLPGTARALLGGFALVHAQDDATRGFFAGLGCALTAGPNLKALAAPAPVDGQAREKAVAAIHGRPIWVASSTHPGEDVPVLAAHRALLADHPDALLILVPRHPERGDEIAKLITQAGLSHARRSAGAVAAPTDSVWLADTIGETALWYDLADVVFLAGSWVPVGGHNPFEPARAGAAVLHGPLLRNFDAVYAGLDAAGGGAAVADADALARALHRHLTDPAHAAAMQKAARAFADSQSGGLDPLCGAIIDALSKRQAA